MQTPDEAIDKTPTAAVPGSVARPSARGTLRHPFVRASFWFFLVIAVAEILARRRVSTETRRLQWLQEQSPHRVVLLGDSTANQGLSPARLREVAGIDAINLAVPSGSGIIAGRDAQVVSFRPALTVYAGSPIEAYDTWSMQRTERKLLPFGVLLRSGMLDADTLMARISALYRESFLVYPQALARVRALFADAPKAQGEASPTGAAAEQHPDGWMAIPRPPRHDPQVQRDDAERKARIWFEHAARTSSVRADALVSAMQAWSPDGRRRALVLMPFSTELRGLLYARIPERDVRARWIALARAADASLLDCSAAVVDEAFYDDDHLHRDAAIEFSTRLAPWIAAAEQGAVAPAPAGCEALR